LRSIVFRFEDSPAFGRALCEGDHELLVPAGDRVGDGAWVLAIFEIRQGKRSTATAARGLHRGGDAGDVLLFERRDWERLIRFARAQRASNRGRRIAQPDASVTRVLLVDEDRDICDVVTAVLEAVGLVVEPVTSAEEAVERVHSDCYDVLVLDWNLPGMTGIELCRQIRADAARSTLPALFLTAQALSRDVIDALAQGADDYVAKPFRALELGARILGLVQRARVARARV
jgi:CheY-like chemotaxis protein